MLKSSQGNEKKNAKSPKPIPYFLFDIILVLRNSIEVKVHKTLSKLLNSPRP